MTGRLLQAGGTAYGQEWDAENRLVRVTGSGQTQLVYDGDGHLVKRVVGIVTTVYVGAYFEKNVTTGATTSYYYAGGTRAAMRKGGVLSYLHGDHLGSASLATSASGTVVVNSSTRYYPYGATRSGGKGMPTEYRFTGQLLDTSLGLYHMGARWYDPALGRWVSPDTIIPDPANPQSFNRYSYCLGNPLKFVDPSGYLSQDEIMQYFGVETWDEVLALFGEFAEFAGQWGFLAMLGAAHVGDRIDIYDASGDCTVEHCKVQLIAQEELKDCDGKVCGISISADAVKQAVHFEHSRYAKWGAGGEWISQGRYGAGIPHLHFDAPKVDWIHVGASLFSLNSST